jgi:hypothetical protein
MWTRFFATFARDPLEEQAQVTKSGLDENSRVILDRCNPQLSETPHR